MTALDTWLKQATRHLSKASGARVQSEIREHYESAREEAMSGEATATEADRLAMVSLGDAKSANRQYRKVLLTSAEARMLREGNWETSALCSRSWLKVDNPRHVFGRAQLGRGPLPYRENYGRLAAARGRRYHRSAVRGAVSADLYSRAGTRFPCGEMDCAFWRPGAAAWPRRRQMVLAAVLLPMAGSLDRLDARLAAPQTARSRLAQAAIPLMGCLA
jgi:hypothetical protein